MMAGWYSQDWRLVDISQFVDPRDIPTYLAVISFMWFAMRIALFYGLKGLLGKQIRIFSDISINEH